MGLLVNEAAAKTSLGPDLDFSAFHGNSPFGQQLNRLRVDYVLLRQDRADKLSGESPSSTGTAD